MPFLVIFKNASGAVEPYLKIEIRVYGNAWDGAEAEHTRSMYAWARGWGPAAMLSVGSSRRQGHLDYF